MVKKGTSIKAKKPTAKVTLTKRGKGLVKVSKSHALPAGCEGFTTYFRNYVWKLVNIPSLKIGETDADYDDSLIPTGQACGIG